MRVTRKNIMSFLFFTLTLLVSIGLLSAAWPGSASAAWKEEWDKVLGKARQEGKVVVWGPPGQLIREKLTGAFSKAFPGIDVEYSGNRGSKHATKLRAEREGGVYRVDLVLSGASTGTVRIKPYGALAPVKPALILPEVTDVKNWRDNRQEFADIEEKFVLAFISQVSPVMNYDPGQVKHEEIDELYELLDPKWKGKIILNDPIPPGGANSFFRWVWHVLGPEKARDFYRKLRAQAGIVSREQRRQIEWVAQGKYPILIGPSHGISQQMLKQGLKFSVSWEFKDYGTWLTPSFGTAMFVDRAPHPNAAKVFLNWLLTKDGQTVWCKTLNHVSRRLDVPTDYLPAGVTPRPGGKYWNGYLEKYGTRSPEERKLLEELFRR